MKKGIIRKEDLFHINRLNNLSINVKIIMFVFISVNIITLKAFEKDLVKLTYRISILMFNRLLK